LTACCGFPAALAVAPSVLVQLLLGVVPRTAAGITVSRVAGAAILALGVVCWLARQDAAGRAARGLVAVMLIYNAAVVAILVLARTNQGLSGIALWPVVLAHAVLAVWCVVALSAAIKKAIRDETCPNQPEETNMKLSIALSALLITGFVAASTEPASAVVYCQYVSYPAGCIVRPGVVLRPRPVARAVVTPGVGAVGVGVRPGTPMNRGGPVNRVGRR
jgi:hypothetical protein